MFKIWHISLAMHAVNWKLLSIRIFEQAVKNRTFLSAESRPKMPKTNLHLPHIHAVGEVFDGIAILLEDAGGEVAEFSEFANRDGGF